jgi:hypothetical protein
MDLINKYLETLQFTRVEDKQGYAIYGAGTAGMFGAGNQRYILLFVPSHLAVANHARASDLPWQNLQTRNLKDSYRLKKQSWNPPQSLPNPQFQVIERKNKHSTYVGPSNFPFEVLLLHDPKKKTKYQYNNHLSLYGVLESFNSVLNYIGAPLVPSDYQRSPSYQGNPSGYTSVQLPSLVNFPEYGQSSGSVTDDQFELL